MWQREAASLLRRRAKGKRTGPESGSSLSPSGGAGGAGRRRGRRSGRTGSAAWGARLTPGAGRRRGRPGLRGAKEEGVGEEGNPGLGSSQGNGRRAAWQEGEADPGLGSCTDRRTMRVEGEEEGGEKTGRRGRHRRRRKTRKRLRSGAGAAGGTWRTPGRRSEGGTLWEIRSTMVEEEEAGLAPGPGPAPARMEAGSRRRRRSC